MRNHARNRAGAVAAVAAAVLAFAVDLSTGGVRRAAAARVAYDIDLTLDLSLTIGTSVLWVGSGALAGQLAGPPACDPCDPSVINRFDAGVVAYQDEAADLASDWVLASLLTLPLAIDATLVGLDSGQTGFGADALVFVETIAITGAINQIVKFSFRRPRPYTYRPVAEGLPPHTADAELSFYSGHTSLAFAAAVAFSRTFDLRYPDSPWRIPVWILSISAAGTTGGLRVASGKHFWSDVAVGAVVGTATALVVVAAHEAPGERPDGDTVGLRRAPPLLFTFGGAF